VLSTYFGCDNLSETDFIRALLVYEKLADILKDSPSIDQSLFTLEIKPIATQIVARLVEHNSKSVIKGFLGLTANELEHMCTNNVASHLIQECLRILGGKEKFEQLSQIYDKLKGRFLNLATNRSGSFVMETLWQTGNLKQRLVMVEELKVAEVKLKNDPIAKFLVNNMGVSFYKRKPEEWKQLQSAEMKKKQMLAELVGQADEELSEKKKKKRKWITDHE